MAFRIKTKTCTGLILFLALTGAAAGQSYNVEHKHLRHGAPGVLQIDRNSISFQESGKGAKHSHSWKYDDIQELTLGPDTMRIQSYEDNRLELGRDRVYLFDKLPASLTSDWYPVFRTQLDRRFVAALADDQVKPLWQKPAKLIHGRSGSQGIVLVGTGAIVYKSAQAGESRSWRIHDIDNVSSAGPFDLAITTNEREFRFQLKQELVDADFQELWIRINENHGLQMLSRTASLP